MGFEGAEIKAEELSEIEVKGIFTVKIAAVKTQFAVVVVLALCGLVEQRMVGAFILVMDIPAILLSISMYLLSAGAHLHRVVSQSVVQERIPSLVRPVVILQTEIIVMFGLLVAFMHFENLQKLPKNFMILFRIVLASSQLA